MKYGAYILLLLANLIYGLNYSIAKEVMPTYIKPFGFVLMRASAAVIFFWFITLFLKKEAQIKVERKDFKKIIACAFFGVFLNQMCFFKGLEFTAPISASVIMTLVPIIVLVLSYFVLSNPLTPFKVLGVILGMIGALIIIFSGGVNSLSAPHPVLGNTLVLTNATSYSLYLILAKPLLSKYPPLVVLKWLFLFGFLMILPFGIQQLQEVQWENLPPNIWGAIAFVLIAVSCLTYLFNLTALKSVNPSTVSVFIYSQPVFAIIYSLWQKNDTLNLMKVLGAFFIFLGVYFVISSNFKKQKE